jgi:uncharacterized protein YbjT (DUF2867 family)
MILITGATGTLGHEIVQQLAANGVATRALVRNPAKASLVQLPGVEIVHGDLDDPASLDAALQETERAFLLTFSSPRRIAQETNLIAAAQRADTRHIVKISIVGAAVESPARILRWHGEAEKALVESGLEWTILRPNYFMQNMFWCLNTIKTRGEFHSSLPEEYAHAHVDARDVAAVAVAALTGAGHVGQTYHITGPEALTYGQLTAVLSKAIGRPVFYDASPERYLSTVLGFGQDAQDVLDLDFCIARGDGNGAAVLPTVLDVAQRPPIPFQQFAAAYAHLFRDP